MSEQKDLKDFINFIESFGIKLQPYQIEIIKRLRESKVVPRHPMRGRSKSKVNENGKAKP